MANLWNAFVRASVMGKIRQILVYLALFCAVVGGFELLFTKGSFVIILVPIFLIALAFTSMSFWGGAGRLGGATGRGVLGITRTSVQGTFAVMQRNPNFWLTVGFVLLAVASFKLDHYHVGSAAVGGAIICAINGFGWNWFIANPAWVWLIVSITWLAISVTHGWGGKMFWWPVVSTALAVSVVAWLHRTNTNDTTARNSTRSQFGQSAVNRAFQVIVLLAVLFIVIVYMMGGLRTASEDKAFEWLSVVFTLLLIVGVPYAISIWAQTKRERLRAERRASRGRHGR